MQWLRVSQDYQDETAVTVSCEAIPHLICSGDAHKNRLHLAEER
jgi:hypothetical protein